ncbi:Cenp-O kinetochore centromere component-domain-containing protein [Aspergillus pseudodeflectus]|uniref:Cenp-O kinetochore centromere component-domain-containing protein n=1 Tax=Aspergillus pseudodeflectus TaxID=176178 RepID=A0ABR4L819_9EURO
MNLNDPATQAEEDLDAEISSIRREIRKLQRRRRFLSSSILSSAALQKRLSRPNQAPELNLSNLNEDISPVVRAAGSHAHSNHHRIAFSTTTFPFKDPSPTLDNETDRSKNLLGARIDICVRNGRFTKPYYLLLQKLRTDGHNYGSVRVKVHRHTIPAFIPVDRLERVFLPGTLSKASAGDGDGTEEAQPLMKGKQGSARKQDLRGFIREVRRQLVAWHMRLDAVHYLRDQIGVIRRGVDAYPDEEEDGPWERGIPIDTDLDSGVGVRLKRNEFGIVTLSPTALEASYIRVEWEDGRVGRFKISNSGLVERAVVIGDKGRDKALEAALTGGDKKVLSVLSRLKMGALAGSDSSPSSLDSE